MWKEFKEFAIEGNVVDLAVAVIIGGAFGKIVTSLVEDIIIPLVSIVLYGIIIVHLVVMVVSRELRYAVFLLSVMDFFISSLSIFLVIRFILRKRTEEEEIEEANTEEQLLTEIRDLLKEQQSK